MKVGFNVKYGRNELDLQGSSGSSSSSSLSGELKDVFFHKVTIYNGIAAGSVNSRRFDRHVIERCMIYNTITEGSDGTVQRLTGTQNVITKDVGRYKPPIEYSRLAEDERENFYTVGIDDFVVLDEVDDVVTTAKEYLELQKKYKGSGFLVTSAAVNIHGLDVDNIRISHT